MQRRRTVGPLPTLLPSAPQRLGPASTSCGRRVANNVGRATTTHRAPRTRTRTRSLTHVSVLLPTPEAYRDPDGAPGESPANRTAHRPRLIAASPPSSPPRSSLLTRARAIPTPHQRQRPCPRLAPASAAPPAHRTHDRPPACSDRSRVVCTSFARHDEYRLYQPLADVAGAAGAHGASIVRLRSAKSRASLSTYRARHRPRPPLCMSDASGPHSRPRLSCPR